MSTHVPDSFDFQNALDDIFRKADQKNLPEIIVKSGELHRQVGGYPSRDHRMHTCCHVMRSNMRAGDQILEAPPKGNGATLVIRYRLPRE